MSERRGFLRSILEAFDPGTRHPYPEVDIILMVALADGPPKPETLDAIDIVVTEEAWDGVDWSVVRQRMEAIAKDAPLFTETRARVKTLREAERQYVALDRAANIAAINGHISDDARTVLGLLAEDFERKAPETRDLLTSRRALRYTRCPLNDPQAPSQPFASALAQATSSDVLRLMMFKLSALRTLLDREDTPLNRPPRMQAIAHRFPCPPHAFIADALIVADAERWLIRCLAPGEALHPEERVTLPHLVDALDMAHRLLILHETPLSAMDRDLIESLDPARTRTLALPAEDGTALKSRNR